MQPRTLRVFAAWACATLILIWAAFLWWKWPFTLQTVVKALESETHRPVKIGSFHGSFWTPGYVAENVTFGKAADADGRAFTVRKLVLTASWFHLITMQKRIKLVEITGLRMRIIARNPADRREQLDSRQDTPPRFSEIGELRFADAVFDFASDEAETEPLTITLKSISIASVSRTKSSPFQGQLSVNEPQMTIHTEGRMGPWNWTDPGKTQLSGSFGTEQADLRSLDGIAGNFSGNGEFRGPLSRIVCAGHLDAPNFQVRDNPHQVDLSTKFHVTVNGLNGDTTIDRVESKLNSTIITTEGVVKADEVRPGKHASLRFSVERGRLEDFLFLFSQSDRPSMTGVISLRANVELPPGPPGFLQKIKMDGDFDIHDGRFASPQTQQEVNHLSKSAEGMSKKEEEASPAIVFSDLKGHVAEQNGIARLAPAEWSAPGANANLRGTYNLLDTTINMQGLLKTTGKLSDTTSGLKTIFLKVATPFWKKNSVTVVPFTITGKARKPVFALSMKKHLS